MTAPREDIRPVRRRRVLVLAPFPPRLDAHGGARVLAELLLGLAAVDDVRLVCLRGPADPGTDDELLERLPATEIAYGHASRPAGGLRARARTYAGLLLGRPTWVTTLQVPGFADHVRRVLASWRPDLVHVHYSVMAQYLDALGDCPAVLVEHDPAVEAAMDIVARSKRGRKRLHARLDARAWGRVLSRALERVAAIAVFSERDATAIRRLRPSARVVVVPLGVRVSDVPLSEPETDRHALLFVGSFMHEPNVDAAVRLALQIFPRVRAAHPAARLDIVGHGPPREVAALAGDGVAVHGDVPDTTPYLARAAVVVVPVRMGGGVRVKVLDALAAGKAVVASPLAVEGIDVTRGSHVLIADTDDELAAAVSTLLADPRRRADLGERAHAWARQHLTWERSADALADLHASMPPDRRDG